MDFVVLDSNVMFPLETVPCSCGVDVSVVLLYSSLLNIDLTTVVGYTVQTWILDSHFVIHRVQHTQNFPGNGPVFVMCKDCALLTWFKVVWIKARRWWCICLKLWCLHTNPCAVYPTKCETVSAVQET